MATGGLAAHYYCWSSRLSLHRSHDNTCEQHPNCCATGPKGAFAARCEGSACEQHASATSIFSHLQQPFASRHLLYCTPLPIKKARDLPL